jgi:hypothetical protein
MPCTWSLCQPGCQSCRSEASVCAGLGCGMRICSRCLADSCTYGWDMNVHGNSCQWQEVLQFRLLMERLTPALPVFLWHVIRLNGGLGSTSRESAAHAQWLTDGIVILSMRLGPIIGWTVFWGVCVKSIAHAQILSAGLVGHTHGLYTTVKFSTSLSDVLAQILSGGLLRATPHYVKAARGQGMEGVARNTFAVFMQPRYAINRGSCSRKARQRTRGWRGLRVT